MAKALRPAQIQITILEPGVLVGFGLVFDVKRRYLRSVEELQLFAAKLHLSRCQVRIQCFQRALGQSAAHRNHVLGTELLRLLVSRRVDFGVKNHLRDTASVPDIDKNQPAMIPSMSGTEAVSRRW